MRQTITFLFFTVFTLVLSAQTVNIQGDPYGGNPYATITDAITAANDGDVILITGTWTETISVSNKSITLRGTDPKTDIIQASASASNDGMGSRVISLSASSTAPDPLPILNITVENLGVRYGNAPTTDNGGGVFSDKITGLLTLKNLIIENNYSAKNGGGLSIDGSNVDIIECTIRNNNTASNTDGGGIIIAPNIVAAIDCTVNIKQSLIDGNSGRNGGGIYINGANTGDYSATVNIENSTILDNNATNTGTGSNIAGVGGILSRSIQKTGESTGVGNVKLNLIHATIANNTSGNGPLRGGLHFGGATGITTEFSAYNSIIVGNDDTATGPYAIDFANTNTTDVVNCILGVLNSTPAIVNDVAKNNLKGQSATEAGLDLITGLESLGGSTKVLAISASSTADDYCTAATGITLPIIDQRGYTREGVADAGAFEFGGTLGLSDEMYKNNFVRIFPNPAQDFVKISGVNTVNSVRVYSILGTLEKVIHNQIEFNVADLSSGIHMMVIESNGLKTVKRIIKK